MGKRDCGESREGGDGYLISRAEGGREGEREGEAETEREGGRERRREGV